MNYLDVYLQKYNLRKSDIIEKFNLSENLISNYNNKKVETYPAEVVISLSKTLNKKPGEILNELLLIEKENIPFEVSNSDDLLLSLKEKYDFINITGDYFKEINILMKSQLTDNERLGFELGSSGTLTILAYLIESIVDIFKRTNKKDIEIEKRLRYYKIKEITESNLLLEMKYN